MVISQQTQLMTTTLGESGPMTGGARSLTTDLICGSSRRIFGKNLIIANNTLCTTPNCNHNKAVCVPCKPDCEICRGLCKETTVKLKSIERLCCENWTHDVNCKTKNVIYLLTCTDCSKCYVGQTKRQARTRFTEHKRESLNWKTKGYSQHNQELYKHYKNSNCDPKNLNLQIICKLPEPWDQKLADEKEVYFIRLLNTAYPIGFNTDIRGYGFINQKITQTNKKVQPYFNFRIIRKPRKRTTNKNKKHHPTDTSLLKNNPLLNYKKLRNFSLLNKEFTIYNNIYNNFNQKTLRPFPLNRPSLKIKIPFLNTEMENNPTIRLIKKACRKALEIPFETRLLYNKRISQYLFNMNYPGRNITKEEMIYALKQTDCCKKFNDEFKTKQEDNNIKHLFTTNGACISDDFAKLTKKGAKFRPNLFNSEYTETFMENFKINNEDLFDKLDDNKKNTLIEEIWSIVNKYRPIDNITNLPKHPDKKRFIICCLDKSTNDVAIVCFNFYVQWLCKQMGLTLSSGELIQNQDGIYKATTLSEIEIIDKQVEIMHKYRVIPVPEYNRVPSLYVIPKGHKKQIGLRPIYSGCTNAFKPMDILIRDVMLHTGSHFYNKICYSNKYYLSDKKLKVNCKSTIEATERLRKHKAPINHIKSYDFSDLFSNIRHEDLKKAMFAILDLCMKDGQNDCLRYKKGKMTYCSYSENQGGWHREELKEIIEVFLANYYIKLGDCCYSQIKGSPMGGSASAVISDLCLAYFEYLYFKNKPKYQHLLCRYVDDIITSDKDFLQIYKEIYPGNLVLTQDEQEKGDSCSFLDLKVYILNNKLHYKTYDKRDHFNFKPTKYADGETCLPSSVKIAIFSGEINRYIITNSDFISFGERVEKLTKDLKDRNYNIPFRKIIKKTLNKQMHRLTKFNLSQTEIQRLIHNLKID